MNKKSKYTIGWYIVCALAGIFFPVIGYQIVTWQWWVGCGLVWIGGWCCLNIGMETRQKANFMYKIGGKK